MLIADDEPDRFGAGLCEFEAALGWDDDGPNYPDGFRVMDRCRQCGCTPLRACRGERYGCYWAERNLCSRCARRPARRRFRRSRLGPEQAAARREWLAELRAERWLNR